MELTNTENIRPPLSVLRCKVEAGVAPAAALMQCRREAHFISVQAGGVTVYMNGEAYVLGTGDSLLVDPYVPHRALPSPETGVDYLSLFLDVSALCDREMAAGLESGTLSTVPLWRRKESGGVLVAGCLRAAFFSCEGGKRGWEFAALGQILTMYAHLSALGAIKEGGPRKKAATFPRRVLDYMAAHYGEALISTDVARALSLHPSDFCRRFRAAFGTTFSLYLSAYRIERAGELLAGGEEPISAVAAAVGFADFSYFSKTFREQMGATPSAYRRARRGK